MLSTLDLIRKSLGRASDSALYTGSVNAKAADILRLLETGTSQVSKVYPAQADATSVTSGSAWVLGSWSQIVAASVIGDASLVGVTLVPNDLGGDFFDVEIGQGGSGSEVTVARVAYLLKQASNVGYVAPIFVPIWPAVALTTDARLAARCASQSGTQAIYVKAHTLPRRF